MDPWVIVNTPGPNEAFKKKWQTDVGFLYQFWPIIMSENSYSDAQIMGHWRIKSQFEALQTVIALEKFRRVNERYPDALAELVPAYMAKVPLDIASGDEMLYLLRDGKPVLYSRGADGDDDKLANEVYLRPQSPEDGDWVIYPK